MSTLACCGSLFELLSDENFIPIVAIAMGCTVGIVAIVSTSISGVLKTRARESTRRELAAYVAEGSLRPEDATALLKAEPTNPDGTIDEMT